MEYIQEEEEEEKEEAGIFSYYPLTYIYVQSKLDKGTLDKRISLIITMQLTKFKFSHLPTRYKKNSRYKNRFTADQRYSYFQL